MRKLTYPIGLILLVFTACKEDFLERAPGVNLSEEEVFSDPVLAAQFGDNSYSFRINDYMRFATDQASTAQLSDEAVHGASHSSIMPFYNGLYHSIVENNAAFNDIGYVWDQSYKGIRNCNVMLSRMDDVPWASGQDPNRIKGEQRFLRAFYYFELTKRFGGVPIFDRPYDVNENSDIPRSDYEACVDFMLADLAEAVQLLPAAYDQTSGPNSSSNYGRATKGAAQALRSRILLYAASPRDNGGNDLDKWKAAAEAAKAVMDGNNYQLQANYDNILQVPSSPEYIWIYIRGPRSPILNFLNFSIKSPGSGGDAGTMNPTQNHVDLYEMQETGLPITDPGSGYDATQPYEGRDPRFYANILYNDAPWQGRRMQLWNGGLDYRAGNPTYSITRYYSKKYWPEVYGIGGTQTALLNYVYFRYAEILLNYAEAMNEAYGADAVPSGYTLSARDAINQLRARPSVDMPPLPEGLSQERMRNRIRNERAVELAFEDHRWYDIMRWKAGPEIVAQTVYGMDVTNNSGVFSYRPVVLPGALQRIYQDHMHYYPIPRREVQKSDGILVQNTGW